ncbi:hypothetical protein LPJ61_000967 [Coemansia biformis]|uniref:RNA helicase n=1 Tax=Coemansia biformis TaxID=1286918 RepID=A0A9W7YAU8_9FUNG|nr:hypothetical protein LPJ61_000967 [Coemansia biformis]
MVSLAIQEHRKLTEELGVSSAGAFDIQALNTMFVVPNRELALQIEKWAGDLLDHAYPAAPRAKYIQRFVSGTEYESRQVGVLKRHGLPAIVVGTPRCLLEMVENESDDAKLLPIAPGLLRWLAEAPQQDDAEYLKRLKRVHGLCRQGREKDSAGAFRGLRRLIVDEVDQILRLPGKYAPRKEKKLRLDKPRPGQQLVDRVLLGVCGFSRVRELLERVTAAAAREASKALAAAAAANDNSSGKQRPKSNAKGWRKDSDAALGLAMDKRPAAEPESPAVLQLRSLCHLVGPRSLQVVALSATVNDAASEWMRTHGWMSSEPIRIDNEEARVVVPRQTVHYCLVIENGETVRNIRPKDKTRAAGETQPTGAKEKPSSDMAEAPERPAHEQVSMMELMAEAAANAMENLQPRGAVIIFTRSDASTTKFGHVLEKYGIGAQDIMARFDPEIQKLIQQKQLEERRVFIATEEAARGIDLPDASLVLILDIPKSAASYAHMAGRAGRYGRQGAVLSVVPIGHMGHFESKMRGIFSQLAIQPTRAPFVGDEGTAGDEGTTGDEGPASDQEPADY